MTGRLFAVVGPSGVGKDTLLAGVCDASGPHWVRRAITRPESAGGEPFEGVTEAEFARRAAAGLFALTWFAHGLAYGIPHAELVPLTQGRDVVFNGSRGALARAVAVFPALSVIHVTASQDVLGGRLSRRGRETKAEIAARLDRVVAPFPPGVRVIEVVNDSDLVSGIAALRAAFQPSETR